MKQTKRILSATLIVIIMVIGIFSITSCNKDVITLAFYSGENMLQQISVVGNEEVELPPEEDVLKGKSGYKFEGWYFDQNKWEQPFTKDTLVNTPIYENTKVYAKFVPITYNIEYTYDAAQSHFPVDSNENPLTYNIESKITLTPLINNSDTLDFDGWYTSQDGGEKIENLDGRTGNLKLYERWKLHEYQVNYHYVNGAQVVEADNIKENPLTYNIDSAKEGPIPILSLARLGYEFKGWYSDPDLTNLIVNPAIATGTTGDLNFYAKWDKFSGDYIRVNENNEEKSDGSYILFGSYPQKAVTDTAILSELNGEASAANWLSYDYFVNGDDAQYMWYADITLASGEKYRGVYFTEYRPAYTDSEHSDSYQQSNGYQKENVYWFKYDYIKWKIVPGTENEGKALLICDMIIDAQAYQNRYTFKDGNYYATDENGNIIKVAETEVLANDYEYSTIKKWLETTFYTTAFSDSADIVVNDSVFLLSAADLTNEAYGFNSDIFFTDINKKKNPTDYTLIQGGSRQNDYQNKDSISWWLSTPNSNHNYATTVVDPDGSMITITPANSTYIGVCPAIWLTLGPVVNP